MPIPEMIEVRRQQQEQQWNERAPAREERRAAQEEIDLAFAETIPDDVEDLTADHIMYRQGDGRGPAFIGKEQAQRYLSQSQERDSVGRLLRAPIDPKVHRLLTYTAIHGPKPTAQQSRSSAYAAADTADILSGGVVAAGDVARAVEAVKTQDPGLAVEAGIGMIPVVGTGLARTPAAKKLARKVGGKAKTKLATHIEKKAVDPQLRYRAAQTLEEGRALEERGLDPRLSIGNVEPEIPLEASAEDVTALNQLAANAPPKRMEDEANALYGQLREAHVAARQARQDVEKKALRSLMIDPNFKLTHEIQMVLDARANRIPYHRLSDSEKELYSIVRNDGTMEDVLHTLWSRDLLEFRHGEVITDGNIISRGRHVRVSPHSQLGSAPEGVPGIDAIVELVDVSPNHIAAELRGASNDAAKARARTIKQREVVQDIINQRQPVRNLQKLEEDRRLGLGGEFFREGEAVPIQYKPHTKSSPRQTQAKRPVEQPGLQADLDNRARLHINQYDGAIIPTSPTVSARNHILTLLDNEGTFSDPIFRSLAVKVANNPLLETVSFTEVARVPGAVKPIGFGGTYSRAHDTILVSERLSDYPQTVVHEAMHAATSSFWKRGRRVREQLKSGDLAFEDLGPIETRTLRFFDQVDDLALQVEQRAKSATNPPWELPLRPYRRMTPRSTVPAGLDPVQSAEGLAYHYGGYNSEEFLSEVMNNREFRAMLKGTTYVTPAGSMSAYDKFLNLLANLMGFSKKEVDVLFKSMEDIDQLFEQGNMYGLEAVPEYVSGFTPGFDI